MKKRNYWILIISLICFIQGRTGSVDEKKGLVTYSDGQVKRKAAAVENWQNAPVNTEVLSGDKVRTYIDSRAELDLAALDIIRLAPRTTIDIVRLYEETKEKKVKTSIAIEEGELWANVHEVEASTEFDISAPVAAAAITGTILRLNVAADSTTQLKVYEGEVQIRKPQQIQGPTQVQGPREVTAEEWVKIVKAMQQITISQEGEIINFSGFSLQDEVEQTPWVKWNHELDNRRLQQLKDRLMEK